MTGEIASLPGALAGTRVLLAHPSGELYGSDRMLLETVSALVEARAEVTLALASDGPLAEHARERGAVVVVCPSPVLRKSMLSVRGLARLIAGTVRGAREGRRLLRSVRPDVVLVNTLTIPLWTVLPRTVRAGGPRARVICHVHEAEGSASRLIGRMLVAPLRFADGILSNSRYSIEVIRRFAPKTAARAALIDNGVVGPAEPHRARVAVDGPVRLLYVGRLSERKGVDVAVDAVRLLREQGREATLDIAGAVFPGYEWYEAALRDRIRSAGLQDAVRLHGFSDDVWALIERTDILLVPSRFDEPFGNTAVEGILGARPVIVSDTSGLREAARGYGAVVFVAPGDAQAIADAAAGLVARWPRVRELAWSDRARAQARHSPAGYRRRIAAAVRSMVPGTALENRVRPDGRPPQQGPDLGADSGAQRRLV